MTDFRDVIEHTIKARRTELNNILKIEKNC